MILLNIGSGPNLMEGVINLDINPNFNPQVIHDLEVTPLPFENESVHGVFAIHILEHIRNLPELIADIHRILLPGGVLEIQVPYYLSEDAWGDPTHIRAFSPLSFLPEFWKGWVVEEVSMRDLTQTYSNYKLRHIFVKVSKEGATDDTTDRDTEN
jgi:SAM-dependent methyltransferase